MTLKWIVLLKNHKNRPVAGSFNPKPPWVWQSCGEEFAMGGGCFGGENQKKGHHQRSSKSLLCARKERPCELQKKKGRAANWFYVSLDYHNFATKFR